MPYQPAFRGDRFYLSNMYRCPVTVWGITFRTSEHAFVWAKLSCDEDKRELLTISDPIIAKAFGQSHPIRQDWDAVKLVIMNEILHAKFYGNPGLAQKLLYEQGDLVEYNNWGDDFWGKATDKGLNYLGRQLMALRFEMQSLLETNYDVWDYWSFGHYVVIPTNIILRSDGTATMGGGLALAAARKFPALPGLYGAAIAAGKFYYINRKMRVICAPSKPDYRVLSTLDDIRNVVTTLSNIPATITAKVVVPAIGCGLGGLSWNDVSLLMQPLRDNPRFVVLDPVD